VLRSSLQILDGSLEMLQDDARLTADQRVILASMEKAIRELFTLIRENTS
jgi:signal transduction histidine kinase